VIAVLELEIERNRIRNCLQLDLSGSVIAAGLIAGLGGIALAAAEYVTIRGNWIEHNGISFVTPICGIFIAMGAGVTIDANQILDNGPQTGTLNPPQPGPRGGIWLDRAITPVISLDFSLSSYLPEPPALPAASVHDNLVSSPMGPALHIFARGAVMVEANQFTSLTLDPQSSFGAGGIPAGLAVWIGNVGVSAEWPQQKYDYTNIGLNAYPVSGIGASSGSSASVYFGAVSGSVLFNDNQVLFDSRPNDPGPILSSVLIASADDVTAEGNQLVSGVTAQQLITHAIVLGLSVRVADNRFQEMPDPNGLSAFTFALMNSTTDNQGTRCFLIFGLPVLSVGSPNHSLFQLIPTDPCGTLSKMADRFAQVFGLNSL
jgi:hypothetical protein